MPPTPVVMTAVVLLVLVSALAASGLGIISRGKALAVVLGVAVVLVPVGYLGEQFGYKRGEHGPTAGLPERGEAFFRGPGGCVACHTIQGLSTATIGPELTHIATVAGTRKTGMTAEAYIRESIQSPTAFVVEGYALAMPAGLASGQNLEDLLAFLLTKP